MTKQNIQSSNMVKDLWDSLQDLQKVYTQSDFLAAARQHAKGKLTIQEKVTLLFDSGTFSDNHKKGLGDWYDLAVSGLDVQFVPGNIFTIRREPHVQILSEQLTAC
ncbi:MAG: hypothetical protein KJP23_05630 [Deltaproteobacteria bacterium]|nr:hypothetical protein [Deltaproteobacteria bacterium]